MFQATFAHHVEGLLVLYKYLVFPRREYNRRVKEVVESSWMEEPDADGS